jgi:hypothetical protein
MLQLTKDMNEMCCACDIEVQRAGGVTLYITFCVVKGCNVPRADFAAFPGQVRARPREA